MTDQTPFAGASSAPARSPRRLPRRCRIPKPAGSSRSRPATRNSRDWPRPFPAPASSPATRHSSTIRRSRRSTSRRRTRRMPNGRSGPPRPASTCFARSRSRSRPRGRGDDRRGAKGRDLPRRSLHVPPPSADREDRRPGPLGGDRRGPHDQGELRLHHGQSRPEASAACQRHRRRRHPRHRLLSGLDGAADRRRGGGQAVPRPGQGVRRRPSRHDRRRRMGLGRPPFPERHHRRGVGQRRRGAGQYAFASTGRPAGSR